MKLLVAHLLCIMSFFGMIFSDDMVKADAQLFRLGQSPVEIEQVQCVPNPTRRRRACPVCLGTSFGVIVDIINPALVLGFECDYCGHFLVVGRVEG